MDDKKTKTKYCGPFEIVVDLDEVHTRHFFVCTCLSVAKARGTELLKKYSARRVCVKDTARGRLYCKLAGANREWMKFK